MSDSGVWGLGMAFNAVAVAAAATEMSFSAGWLASYWQCDSIEWWIGWR